MASSRFKSEGILQNGRLWPLGGGKNEEGRRGRGSGRKQIFMALVVLADTVAAYQVKSPFFSRVLRVHHEVIRALC